MRACSPAVLKQLKKEDARKRLVGLTSSIGKVMEEIGNIPQSTTKASKVKKVMGSCWCGFTKGRSCSRHRHVFYVKVSGYWTVGEQWLLLSYT